MAYLQLDAKEFDRLQNAIKNYPSNAEEAINDVFHNQASPLIQESIIRLMPRSNAKPWKGKLPHAKESKSLTDVKESLSITVKSSKKYGYLYFPDDGTNTRRHAGNQQFFMRGAELEQEEIIDRCVKRLVGDFENL